MWRKPNDAMSKEKKGLGQRIKDKLGSFAEMRRHARQFGEHQLRLKIEGKSHATVNWSCGGFALDGFHRELTRGEAIEGRITAGIARVKDRHFEGRVVRVPEHGYIGVQFTEISTAAFRALTDAQGE